METITIKEFRNLVPHCSDRGSPCGNFAIGDHKKICETVKVGDVVNFLMMSKTDTVPNVEIVEVTVEMDDTVSFMGTKLPVRNELEN